MFDALYNSEQNANTNVGAFCGNVYLPVTSIPGLAIKLYIGVA